MAQFGRFVSAPTARTRRSTASSLRRVSLVRPFSSLSDLAFPASCGSPPVARPQPPRTSAARRYARHGTPDQLSVGLRRAPNAGIQWPRQHHSSSRQLAPGGGRSHPVPCLRQCELSSECRAVDPLPVYRRRQMTTPGQMGAAPCVSQGERGSPAAAGRLVSARTGSHAVGRREASGGQ